MLQCLPACAPADHGDWEDWKCTCFQFALFRPVIDSMSALSLNCIEHGTISVGGDNFSKSAGDGPDSNNLPRGRSKNLHNLSPSETKSPYGAGCLPFSNEIKVLIPICFSSWAQIQQ